MATNPIPEEYPGITPYLSCRSAVQAIEFYKKAFGARETMRFEMPDGKVGHAEMRIGSAVFMLADEFPSMNFVSPQSLGGSPVTMHMYVEDVDAFVKTAE